MLFCTALLFYSGLVPFCCCWPYLWYLLLSIINIAHLSVGVCMYVLYCILTITEDSFVPGTFNTIMQFYDNGWHRVDVIISCHVILFLLVVKIWLFFVVVGVPFLSGRFLYLISLSYSSRIVRVFVTRPANDPLRKTLLQT